MPISKKGNLYFTDQQYVVAREVRAIDYAIQHYDLKRVGNSYKMREHDSLVFTQNGMFFWNSRNIIGNAIKFIEIYEERSTVEAVLILAGELDRNTGCLIGNYSNTNAKKLAQPGSKSNVNGPYIPPVRDISHRKVFAYLTQTRGILPELVSDLMKQKKIYQSYVSHNGKKIYNAVFLLKNKQGVKGALLRGITDNNCFKSVHAGSDRERGYFYFTGPGQKDTLYVFESPIEAMSYYTLLEIWNQREEHPGYYVARGGTGDKNVFQFLREHPELKRVVSCDNNDDAGNRFAESLLVKLKVAGYVTGRKSPDMKDYNLMLTAIRKEESA